MNRMNANKLMALLGLEYPTTSRYKKLHAAVTQALEVARVEGATDCCMAYDCERLKPQPAEPVQKLRPDFIAGYDAGMKDMMRRVKTEIAEQPLPEPQPEASELRICARRVLIAWDGTVLPKSRDSLMQERMEDLRVALDFEEPSPSKKLLAAGFTPRDRRLECDECGAKVTPQMMPLHECEQPEGKSDVADDNLVAELHTEIADKIERKALERVCAERDALQAELKKRNKSASDRLHNICREVEAESSVFSRGEWDRIDAENVALHAEIRALKAAAAARAGEPTDAEIDNLYQKAIDEGGSADHTALNFARAVLAALAGLGAQRGN